MKPLGHMWPPHTGEKQLHAPFLTWRQAIQHSAHSHHPPHGELLTAKEAKRSGHLCLNQVWELAVHYQACWVYHLSSTLGSSTSCFPITTATFQGTSFPITSLLYCQNNLLKSDQVTSLLKTLWWFLTDIKKMPSVIGTAFYFLSGYSHLILNVPATKI